MVGFDASFALLIWSPNAGASVPNAKERVAYLVGELHQKQEKIIIPTPALSELLVKSGNAGQQYLNEITKSARFKVAPFDTMAAVEVAARIGEAINKGNKKAGSKGTWAKVKFDQQIAAIAKVEGAHTLYTDDEDLAKFAEKMGLEVVALADLPVPPSKTPLFDNLPDEEEVQAVPPPPPEADAKI